MPPQIAVEEGLPGRHFLMMVPDQLVGAVIDTEILKDAFPLDVGVVSVEIDDGVTKIPDCHPIAAEGAGTMGIGRLQIFQILFIQDKSLQLVPKALQIDLYPAVKDLFGRKGIYQPCHCPLLQPFIDGEAVNPAGNAAAPEQGHEEGSLGIALAVAVCEHRGGGEAVIGVVAEQDLIPDKVIDIPDTLKFSQAAPASLVNQILYSRIRKIQHGCFHQVSVHILSPFLSNPFRKGRFGR